MGLLGWAGDEPLDLDFGKADLIFLQSSIVFPLGTCGMRSWVDASGFMHAAQSDTDGCHVNR